MTSLPETPFTLKGGCFCKSIRYTISVPALADRPVVYSVPKNPVGVQTEVSKHLPVISFDHCHSCRRVAGTIIETWIICPQRWVSFTLVPSFSSPNNTTTEEFIKPTTAEVVKPSKELLGNTNIHHFLSSERCNRTFCGKCGTHLTFHYDDAGQDPLGERPESAWGPHCDIALGTLDDGSLEMDGVRPARQTWYGDGISWVKTLLDEGVKGSFS